MARRLPSIPLAGALALAVTVQFVLHTVLLNRFAAVWLVAAETLIAALVALALVGRPSAEQLRSAGGASLAAAAALGVVGLWLPQLLVLTHRYTDAPSGSESLFFATAAWAVPVMIAASLRRSERPRPTQWIAVLLGVAGAAAILANWERPSSFSPLVKFPLEEAFMVGAGLCWAGYGLAASILARRVSAPVLIFVAGLAAATAAVLLALVAGEPAPLVQASADVSGLLALGVAGGVAWWAWTSLARSGELDRGAAPLLLPPVLLSGLALTERLGTVYGPRPILLVPVGGGATIVLLAAVAGWIRPRGAQVEVEVDPVARRVAMLLGVVSAVLGLIGLAWPRLAASVVGELANGEAFAADWRYLGAETAGGWIAALLPLGLLALARVRAPKRAFAVWALGAALVVVAYVAVADTPLRTWNQWLPPEVQQDYGTEYARLDIEPLVSWPERAAAGGSLVGFVVLAVVPFRRGGRPRPRPDDRSSTEVSA